MRANSVRCLRTAYTEERTSVFIKTTELEHTDPEWRGMGQPFQGRFVLKDLFCSAV